MIIVEMETLSSQLEATSNAKVSVYLSTSPVLITRVTLRWLRVTAGLVS